VKVVLIRHGEASDAGGDSDAVRYLTRQGRDSSRAVAEQLSGRSLAPTQIYTSPLVRAVQTAEILAHAVEHPGPVLVHERLVPGGGTMAQVLAVLERHAEDDIVAFVTHEPLVRALAGHLSGLGGAFPGFRTSGAAVIELRDGAGMLAGRIDPNTLGWRGPDDLAP
jgi:phosphohistidine phosphatase